MNKKEKLTSMFDSCYLSNDPERPKYKKAFDFLIDYIVALPYDKIELDDNDVTMWVSFDMHIKNWFVSVARAIDAEYNEVWVHISPVVSGISEMFENNDKITIGKISMYEAQQKIAEVVKLTQGPGAGIMFEHDKKNESDDTFATIRNEYQEKEYATV